MDDKRLPKILIVDDDPFMLSVLSGALRRLGYHDVQGETHSRQALELCQGQEQPNVLLLDLNMPEMDGVEFLRLLSETDYCGGVVLISGEDERILQTANNLARSHRLQVLGHLPKPPDTRELQRIVDRWQLRTKSSGQDGQRQFPALSEAEIRFGLAAGELVNYYQPKVDVASQRLVGVETLVRWRHRTLGIVPPDRFIPVVEACGLIDQLTRVVLSGALAQAQVWESMGLNPEIAVNVSMDNLKSLDFPDEVISLATKYGVPAERITLEVTESQLARDITLPMDILTRLRLKRVSLSIDDFGTGYSSLAQLMDLPFDELKIDRGFVQAANSDDRARVILESSLQLARKLGMRSVAEGVETEAQWQMVAEQGCNLIQGYFIARPMPGEELLSWARARGEVPARPISG